MKRITLILLFISSLSFGQTIYTQVGNTWHRKDTIVPGITNAKAYKMLLGSPGVAYFPERREILAMYWAISRVTGLQDSLTNKYSKSDADARFVHLTGNETIAGSKTFSSPVLTSQGFLLNTSGATNGYVELTPTYFNGQFSTAGLAEQGQFALDKTGFGFSGGKVVGGVTSTGHIVAEQDFSHIAYAVGAQQSKLRVDATGITVTDPIALKGITLADDYSANFTNESLVTKRWVDANFNSASSILSSTKGGSGVNNAGTLTWGAGGTLGTNAYESTAKLPLAGGTLTGNLGIGTAASARKLDILAGAGVTPFAAVGVGGYITIDNVGSGENYFDASVKHEFQIGGVPKFTIGTSGVVFSSLTAGRVPYIGTAGLIQDDADFQFDGTNLSVGGDISASSLNSSNGVYIKKDGSNTVGSGPLIQLYNNAGTRGWITQLNASNNLDFWHLNGGWSIKQTLNSDGTVTVATPTLGGHATTKTYVDNADALKANIASPTLTGTPAAPTATAGTNTTQIATTAFVRTALLSTSSVMLKDFYANAVTVNGDATNLYTYAVPANTLNNNGDKLKFRYAGSYNNGSTKSLTVSLNGGGGTFNNRTATGPYWVIEGIITRTGATSYRFMLSINDDNSGKAISGSYSSADFTASQNLILSGQATSGTTGDIAATLGVIEFLPAAP